MKPDVQAPYFVPVAFGESMWDGRRVRADVTIRPARPEEGVAFAMFLSMEEQGRADETRLACELSREVLVRLARAAGVGAEDLEGA